MGTAIQDTESILSLIEAHKAEIKALGVRRLSLFGSFLRGDQNLKSDVDFLVAFEPGRKSSKNLMELRGLLEEFLGRHVELVTPESLDQYIGPYILQEIESGGVMKIRKSPIPYLRHIVNEAAYLIDRSKRLHEAEFMENDDLLRAFVRSLEIMGEAAKKVPAEFRKKYGAVDWKGMAGMRDRLIHAYDTVDYEEVWKVVTKEVPTVKRQIEEIIETESKK